jgi:hypothetical protein
LCRDTLRFVIPYHVTLYILRYAGYAAEIRRGRAPGNGGMMKALDHGFMKRNV